MSKCAKLNILYRMLSCVQNQMLYVLLIVHAVSKIFESVRRMLNVHRY